MLMKWKKNCYRVKHDTYSQKNLSALISVKQEEEEEGGTYSKKICNL